MQDRMFVFPMYKSISSCAVYPRDVAYSVPIPSTAHLLHLGLHGFDVEQRPFLGMDSTLDCCILGRQTKGIPSDGMQDLVALHVLEAGQDIGDGVYS